MGQVCSNFPSLGSALNFIQSYPNFPTWSWCGTSSFCTQFFVGHLPAILPLEIRELQDLMDLKGMARSMRKGKKAIGRIIFKWKKNLCYPKKKYVTTLTTIILNEKSRREKDCSAQNCSQDLLCTGPHHYHCATWEHTIKEMIMLYLSSFP